ncbi:hypothetical protein P5W99_10905 [Paraburkholderia sp. A3BS-1L]|uniref:hypothetical protein n=1 Tax=Paraburkholderia sp. A3BS-1L TaxID=3028375 RepID=UPI003DA7FE40
MSQDTGWWFSFFPPSISHVQRVAHRLRRISPLALTETRALDLTAIVFGYADYENLVEELAEDPIYPHKWDQDIDASSKAERYELQVSSLEKHLDVPGSTAEYLVKLWRPSHRPPSFDAPDLETRMTQAKSELARIRANPKAADASD